MLSPDLPKEPTLTFCLFNAGSEDVRDIKARWSLPDVSIPKLVRESPLFEDEVQDVTDVALKLLRHDGADNSRGSIVSLSTDIECLHLPLLRAGDTEIIRAPEAFTRAYTLCAVVRVKSHQDKAPKVTLDHNPLEVLEKFSAPMDEMRITLSYVKGDKRCRHAFRVQAVVFGVGDVPSATPRDDGSYSLVRGAFGSVDRVTVIADEK